MLYILQEMIDDEADATTTMTTTMCGTGDHLSVRLLVSFFYTSDSLTQEFVLLSTVPVMSPFMLYHGSG